MIDCYRLWRHVWPAPTSCKRPRPIYFAEDSGSERLEERALLSAVMSNVAEAPLPAEVEASDERSQLKHGRDHARSTPRKKEFPQLAGTWTYTVFRDGGSPVVGELELTQKGKKISGTLTREFQPPGAFKGKLKSEQPDPQQGRDVPELVWFLLGNVTDVSLASKKLQFEFTVIFVVDPGGYDKLEGTVKAPEGEVPVTANRDIA